MTSRKIPMLVAAAGVTALALAGCSAGNQAGAAGSVEGSSIVLQTVSQLEPQFQQYADAYMELYPDRTVEVRSTTDQMDQYAQQLATGRISGELPDVFFNVDSLANTLADNNVTLDLAPGIKEGKLGDLTLDDFLPQFVGQYRPLSDPERITGLPVSADSVALFYNKTLFAQYGVTELPSAEWTWDDVYRVAEQIQTASNGAIIGIKAPLDDGGAQITFGPMIKAFGGYVYDPDTGTTGIGSPEAIKAWEYLMSFYGTASQDFSSAPDQTLDFAAANVAMTVGSRAGVPNTKITLADDWDVEVLPTIEGESTTGGGSYGLSIAQTSQQQDAAWAFLEWFYDTDKGMKLAQEVGGVIPPTEDGIENGIWKDGTPPPANLAIFGDSARDAVLLAQMPGGPSSVLTEATKKATQQVMLEGRDLTEAFQEAATTVQRALDDELGK